MAFGYYLTISSQNWGSIIWPSIYCTICTKLDYHRNINPKCLLLYEGQVTFGRIFGMPFLHDVCCWCVWSWVGGASVIDNYWSNIEKGVSIWMWYSSSCGEMRNESSHERFVVCEFFEHFALSVPDIVKWPLVLV